MAGPSCVTLSLTLVSALLTFAPVAWGCYCAPDHPQNTYCKAEYAMKADVIAYTEVYDDSEDGSGEPIPYSRYEVILREAYKGPVDLEAGASLYVYSAPRMSSCFVHLEIDLTYILLGHMVENKAFLYSCGGSHLWAHLTSRMMRGYRFLYGQHCNCTVQPTFRPNTEPNPEANEFNCMWYMREDREHCFARHGLCKKREEGCKWSRTDNLRDCLGFEQPSIEEDDSNDVPLPPFEP